MLGECQMTNTTSTSRNLGLTLVNRRDGSRIPRVREGAPGGGHECSTLERMARRPRQCAAAPSLGTVPFRLLPTQMSFIVAATAVFGFWSSTAGRNFYRAPCELLPRTNWCSTLHRPRGQPSTTNCCLAARRHLRFPLLLHKCRPGCCGYSRFKKLIPIAPFFWSGRSYPRSADWLAHPGLVVRCASARRIASTWLPRLFSGLGQLWRWMWLRSSRTPRFAMAALLPRRECFGGPPPSPD